MTEWEDAAIYRLSDTQQRRRRAIGICIQVAVALALVVIGKHGPLQGAEDSPAVAVDAPLEDTPALSDDGPAVDDATPVKGNEEAAIPRDEHKQRYIHLEAYWERGLNYEIRQQILSVYPQRRQDYGFASDALLTGRIGFRIAADAAAYVETGGLDHVRNDIDLRRAFVYFTGDFFLIYPASFKVEIGTITDSVYIQSAWVRWRQLPYVGTFKVGQYDAPFGLEALGSSNDLTFMESASPTQAFAPGTKFGLQLADTARQETLTWALGWFADTQDTDVGDASNSLARLIGRLTYLPHEAGTDNTADRRLLHVGLATTFTYSASDSVRYESRPESFLAPVLVDTGDIGTSG